ncbi:Spy/CpxP family protein refolding chaperone [Marinobacterium sp. AK62]|uniref:Signaling pathway modulator ZraP n=1 Tax=Marinobacterium alkalitolerans TaxID=1542925 RepID=A0ABS3Z962_9GAMM|nr:periplasmic heavy metal sensor [Marinobacterium alkalitolerans]MBP0047850.1 Spy/CpxP family protein refolding chaperone [Marinobacterium alkalitolerans]
MFNQWRSGALMLLISASLSSPAVAQHHMGSTQGMGPGMMQGQSSMPGYGMGYGYGMGMMQGYGPMMGPGMMMGGPMMGGMGMIMGGPMMGGMGMMPCPMQYGNNAGIELTAQQQEQMQAIQEKHWQVHQDHMTSMQQHHARMQSLWQDGKPDNRDILDAHRDMQKLQLEMLEQRLKLQDEMEAILTDEQRESLHRMYKRGYPSSQ